MKEKKKVGKILIFTLLAAIAAYAIYDLIQLRKRFIKYQDDTNREAKKRVFSKKKNREDMVKETLAMNVERFEKAMEEHGAVLRSDLDSENIEKFELRPIYEYKGNYYRVGTLVFEGESDPYIVINAIDNERFAQIGVMEEIEAYPYDIPEERVREVVAEVLEAEL
ncbi:MAG: hypothetical protein VZQ83_03155 [Eubacterium sp.]|nr:hypothetical protein [Eubacterium sp.]